MYTTYDPSAGIAYIYLRPSGREDGRVGATVPLDALEETWQVLALGSINLDFDPDGTLVGIEVLSAASVLPVELLEQAQRP
jgi:uncharacterized protein YuzE